MKKMSIGTDLVAIKRFAPWISYNRKKLMRIFSSEELDYCFSRPFPAYSLAARFAAKEAFFKALSSMRKKDLHFLFVAKNVAVTDQPPYLQVNWGAFQMEQLNHSISLTHTDEIAQAIVILYDSF
jgi:holo-[acyl-carrier protein] synthase